MAQAFGVQAFEVDRLQQERREAAGRDQVADGLAGVRIQDGRAVDAEHGVEVLVVEAAQTEQARLAHLGQVDGLVLSLIHI